MKFIRQVFDKKRFYKLFIILLIVSSFENAVYFGYSIGEKIGIIILFTPIMLIIGGGMAFVILILPYIMSDKFVWIETVFILFVTCFGVFLLTASITLSIIFPFITDAMLKSNGVAINVTPAALGAIWACRLFLSKFLYRNFKVRYPVEYT